MPKFNFGSLLEKEEIKEEIEESPKNDKPSPKPKPQKKTKKTVKTSKPKKTEEKVSDKIKFKEESRKIRVNSESPLITHDKRRYSGFWKENMCKNLKGALKIVSAHFGVDKFNIKTKHCLTISGLTSTFYHFGGFSNLLKLLENDFDFKPIVKKRLKIIKDTFGAFPSDTYRKIEFLLGEKDCIEFASCKNIIYLLQNENLVKVNPSQTEALKDLTTDCLVQHYLELEARIRAHQKGIDNQFNELKKLGLNLPEELKEIIKNLSYLENPFPDLNSTPMNERQRVERRLRAKRIVELERLKVRALENLEEMQNEFKELKKLLAKAQKKEIKTINERKIPDVLSNRFDLLFGKLDAINKNIERRKKEEITENIDQFFFSSIGKKINKILEKKVEEFHKIENAQILENSKGFTPKEFFDRFIDNNHLNKDSINVKWSGKILEDKVTYEKIVSNWEKRGELVFTFYKSSAWKTKRSFILKRDSMKCKICGKKSIKNQVHHLNSALYNPEICLDDNNLITLCPKCHNHQ